MQQFEDLMQAAGQVGAASRPLPLFYALSQAGRAMASAHAAEPWKLHGHGLSLEPGQSLLERRVTPDKKPAASFRRVAQASGSDVLEQPVTIGALCASLPELAVVSQLCGEHPRALSVQPITQSVSGAMLVMSREVEAYVFNLPADTVQGASRDSMLNEHLRHYPTAEGWALPENGHFFPPKDGWGAGRKIRWQVSNSVQSPNEPDRQDRIREVAPRYRRFDQYWCRPAIDHETVLSPLMTWWALLFALSMVARYEPDEWVSLLNVDDSSLAVPLEGVLDDAFEAVPHLVLDVLQAGPFLLPSFR